MDISDAQRDVPTVFLGGFAGQLVASVVWFVSAALATWRSPRAAIIAVVIAGTFIFPLTQLLLRLMGRNPGLPKGHPMNDLGRQVAFTLPFNLPLVAAATLYRLDWFYPALMIALGTHYLPFMFLYGMWQFGILAASLIAVGLVLGLYLPSIFSLGAWFTALALLIFAFAGRSIATQEGK
jgi:small basic protein